MKQILTALALVMGLLAGPIVGPAWAQTTTEEPAPEDGTTEDGTTEDGTTEDGTDEDGNEDGAGNFSRSIPEGLKKDLSEEELADFQERLDAANTPQERNAVRQELQRLSVERHREAIKAKQEAKKEETPGFFGGLMKKLGEGAKKRQESDAKADKERSDKGLSKDRGGSGGGKSKGKSGGRGGGKGGGKNK